MFTLTTSTTDADAFVLKLDYDGKFVWASALGGSAEDVGKSIAVDALGNVYTTGYFHGSADFDPGPAVYNINGSFQEDIFISKLDSTGNFVWAKSVSSQLNEEGYGIAVDNGGNVYTTGYFGNTVDFDPSPTSTFYLSAIEGGDAFILKLNPGGNFVWAKSFGGAVSDVGQSVKIDKSGNVIATGYFADTVDFDPGIDSFVRSSQGHWDVYVLKLDSLGSFDWVKTFGGTYTDRAFSLALDSADNIYATGYFSNSCDFDPGNGSYVLSSAGGFDLFVTKLNANGDFVFTDKFGGTGDDYGSSISVGQGGYVYAAGHFESSATMTASSGGAAFSSSGGHDIVTMKLTQCIPLNYYVDSDSDGYGNAAFDSISCNQPLGYVQNNLDCNDSDANLHPGGVEICGNGVDDNCNGQIDETCPPCNKPPLRPGVIVQSGAAKVCPGEIRNYSVPTSTNGFYYFWTAPTGATIISGQGSSSVTIVFDNSLVTSPLLVTVSNGCGTSPVRPKTITKGTSPTAPSLITGENNNVCERTWLPYSVNAVAGLTYTWSFNAVNAAIADGQGSASIHADFSPGYLTGILSVAAANGCGTSASRNLTIKAAPIKPAAISGPTTVCANAEGQLFYRHYVERNLYMGSTGRS